MIVYRIASSQYIEDLSGTGSKMYGGRWNKKGTSMLYCSEHASLAMLEILVHFDALTIPDNLHIISIEIDDASILDYSLTKFTSIQKSRKAEFLFKDEGEKWIQECSSLSLRVPSIILPIEHNILVNPSHPAFNDLCILEQQKLDLDPRLF